MRDPPWPGEATRPTTAASSRPRALVATNFLLFQAAWFAVILSAADGRAWIGSAAVAAVVGWHLAFSSRPAREALLVAAAVAVGAVLDSVVLASGSIVYTGHATAWAPHWILALWALFATTLNVSLAWLHGRPWLAAGLGAVAAPLSYAAGVRLGAGRFVDMPLALTLLGAGWAAAMPLLVRLAQRWNGWSAARG